MLGQKYHAVQKLVSQIIFYKVHQAFGSSFKITSFLVFFFLIKQFFLIYIEMRLRKSLIIENLQIKYGQITKMKTKN